MPGWVALAVVIGTFVRFGYSFGVGDHDELIPSVLRLLNPALYPQDWIVETVAVGINVRTYFLWLVALPSLVLPIWVTTLLLWIVVAAAVAYGVFGLAEEISRDQRAALVATLLATVVTVRFTIGANAVIGHMLTPEGVAWALSIPAITLFLRGRFGVSGLLFGVATWFHLLAGLHPALILGLATLPAVVKRQQSFSDLIRFGGAFVMAGLPMLVPVAWDHLIGATADPEGPSPFYIHAYFRNPFHHLVSEVPAGQFLRFGSVFALGIAAGWWLNRHHRLHHGSTLAWGAGLAVVLIAMAAVLVEVVHNPVVMKLQFLKLTLLLILGASILIAGACVHAMGDLSGRFFDPLFRARTPLLIATLVVGVLITVGSVTGVFLGDRAHPHRHAETPLSDVERWAVANTATDALFAIPPSVSTFRTYARRSVVANYSAFVFTDADMQRWFERLTDVAPITPPPTAFNVRFVLDRAYHELDAAYWQTLVDRYDMEYILVDARQMALDLPVAFENSAWRVHSTDPLR